MADPDGYAPERMDVATFLRQSGVLVVAGKGGVGKTTVTAALARLAADHGLGVLVVDLEGKSGVPTAFGRGGGLDYGEADLYRSPGAPPDAGGTGGDEGGVGGTSDRAARVPPGVVRARRITPDDALLEYLSDHGLRRVSKRLVSSGVLDVVATAIPGIRDILVLGKVKQLERAGAADVVLVDAPATGHAMTFLSSARGLLDAARSGPVRAQAADVVELLADPARCQVVLVTLPEEMPVNEVVEAAYQLEDRIGIALAPVVVNACLPDHADIAVDPGEAAARAGVTLSERQRRALAEAATFRLHRRDLQRQQLDRLADELPLAQLLLPAVPGSGIGPSQLAALADALADGVRSLPEGTEGAAGARTGASGSGAGSPTGRRIRATSPGSDGARVAADPDGQRGER